MSQSGLMLYGSDDETLVIGTFRRSDTLPMKRKSIWYYTQWLTATFFYNTRCYEFVLWPADKWIIHKFISTTFILASIPIRMRGMQVAYNKNAQNVIQLYAVEDYPIYIRQLLLLLLKPLLTRKGRIKVH